MEDFELSIVIDAVNKAHGELDKAKRDLENLKKAGQATKDSMKELGAGSEKTNKSLEATGRSAEKAARQLSSLERMIRTTARISQTADGIERFGGAMKQISVTPMKSFMDWEQAMTEVASKAEISKLSDDFKKLKDASMNIRLGFNPTDLARGQKDLAAAGYSTTQILDTLGASMNLAAADGAELGATSASLVTILKGYGKEASEAGRVSDLLAVASGKSLGSIASFAEGMKTVGPAAKSQKVPIEETIRLLMALDNAGFQGAEGGTALRNMMVSLAAPNNRVRKDLKALGLSFETVTKVGGKTKKEFIGLEKSLLLIQERMKDPSLGSAQKTQFLSRLLGRETLAAGSAVLGALGGNEYNTNADFVNNADGYAAKKAEENTNSTEGKYKQLIAEWEKFKIQLGGTSAQSAIALMKDLTGSIKTLGSFAAKYPGLTGNMIKLAGGLALFGTVVPLVLRGIVTGMTAITGIRKGVAGAVAGAKALNAGYKNTVANARGVQGVAPTWERVNASKQHYGIGPQRADNWINQQTSAGVVAQKASIGSRVAGAAAVTGGLLGIAAELWGIYEAYKSIRRSLDGIDEMRKRRNEDVMTTGDTWREGRRKALEAGGVDVEGMRSLLEKQVSDESHDLEMRKSKATNWLWSRVTGGETKEDITDERVKGAKERLRIFEEEVAKRSEVSGQIKITIDQDGRASVETESNTNVRFTADPGMSMMP